MHSWLTKLYHKADTWHRGQTMTEYALILSAIAVGAYYGYDRLGDHLVPLLYRVGALFG